MTELACVVDAAPAPSLPAPNARLCAIAKLHQSPELARFVLELDPRELDTVKMCLTILAELETSCAAELSTEELAFALEGLLKDSQARPKIVELYRLQQRKLKAPLSTKALTAV